jgi:hypothetical protein
MWEPVFVDRTSFVENLSAVRRHTLRSLGVEVISTQTEQRAPQKARRKEWRRK